MIRVVSLRWVFLVAAVVSGAWCVLLRATPGRAAFAAVSGLAWYGLSRRKVLSLDRSTLGIPPRA
jgi:hypothetical protein